MGNVWGGNSNGSSRRRRSGAVAVTPNQYIVTAPSHYPNPNLPTNYNPQNNPNHHRLPPGLAPPPPQLEHQTAVTVRTQVNVKRETISVIEDPNDPGRFLLGFTFDALSSGSITVAFFAKEAEECDLILTKDDGIKQVRVPFEGGLGQEFRQPSGTGIDFSVFDEMELMAASGEGSYPLTVKVEAGLPKDCANALEGNSSGNYYIALAVFEKREKGGYSVRVARQILWVNGVRHELQEIYGIGNSVDVESEDGDSGKECVICMTEPRNITVLPCRHMCLCSECAKALHLQSQYRCPICRQRVDQLLEIKVNHETQG